MARVSVRDIFRLRNSFLSHPIVVTPKPGISSSSFCYSFEDRATSLYRSSLTLLETCQSMRQLYQIQTHLITSGLFSVDSLAIKVLKHSANYGDVDYTILIFRCIESPGTFCVNTVVKAYSVSLVPHQAVVFYFEMLRNGFRPNSFTFPPLVNACAKMNTLKDGKKCHGQVTKNGFDDILPIRNSLIHMYASCGDVETAQEVFDEFPEKNLVSWNSIVDGYAKVGQLSDARKLFDTMPERNVISWNVMITGYLECGMPGRGLKLFRKMMKTGLRGSDTTMVSVLTACGRSGRLKEGKSVHGSFVRMFRGSSIILDTALIDMYGKCQRVELARVVFDRMSKRNMVCWNAMILGHCIHGNPEDGLNLFAQMEDKIGSEDRETDFHRSIKQDKGRGVLPDEITFIGILCSCARAGLLMEGRNYFRQMIDLFGINPNFAHYWCMANIFAAVGLIQDAEETLKNMPVDDGDTSSETSLWAGLLGLCRYQGNVTLGEQIAHSLIDLEPQNLLFYSLLLNVYAAAGQWEDVSRVKEMIRTRGFQKIPNSSLVDLKEIVHKLKLGNQWQQEGEEVNLLMKQLAQRLNLSSTSSHSSPPPPLQGAEAKS